MPDPRRESDEFSDPNYEPIENVADEADIINDADETQPRPLSETPMDFIEGSIDLVDQMARAKQETSPDSPPPAELERS